MKIHISNKGLNNNRFPFPFLQSFADFINSHPLKKYILLRDDNGNCIPAVLSKSSFLKILQLQFVPVDANAERLNINAEQLFLEELVNFLSKEKLCDKIIQGTNYALFNAFPKSAQYAPFGSYVLNLQTNLNNLFDNLHSKNRNVIRNAQKHEVRIVYGKSVLNDFYFLYKKTTTRSNLYCEDIDYFRDMYERLNDNVICSVCYHKNVALGGLFVLFTDYGGFYLYGASSDKSTINGAVNYLQWDLICSLKNKGVKKYDFVGARLTNIEGTKLHGIQQFKLRFGSHLEKGYLWKLEINKIKCTIYNFLFKIKLILKGNPFPKDIIDQENKKLLLK